jgi:arylsulfatase A-like enzyme
MGHGQRDVHPEDPIAPRRPRRDVRERPRRELALLPQPGLHPHGEVQPHDQGVHERRTYGGYGSFHDASNTVGVWLHDDGYRTGLFGKYLNGYYGPERPPGWSSWYAFSASGLGLYYDYVLIENGIPVRYGHEDADYSTDVLTEKVDQFIRTTPSGQPLFAYFAPNSPHEPTIPARKYRKAFANLPPYRPPNFDEADVSDKPAWVRSLPSLTPAEIDETDTVRRKQLQAMLSVDDAVGTIVQALADTGRLSNSLLVFMSDNGYSWGEHRWPREKEALYEEDIRVPLIIRWDAVIPAVKSDDHLVLNVDLASTFAAVAGVPSPESEGLSLVPLLIGSPPGWRSSFLIEHLNSDSTPRPVIPTYCAVRTERYLYGLLGTGEQELYDLRLDPWELTNEAGSLAYADVTARLSDQERTLCQPKPPDFDPPPPPS